MVFENRVLRRVSAPKRNEIIEGCRKLHNVEFHNCYSSPNLIRMINSSRMRWEVHAACMGETRNANRVLMEKLKEKRPLGIP
jgi:hypothetical protein